MPSIDPVHNARPITVTWEIRLQNFVDENTGRQIAQTLTTRWPHLKAQFADTETGLLWPILYVTAPHDMAKNNVLAIVTAAWRHQEAQ